MHNYLIKIEYDGTKFVGWQYQKNGTSIQGTIEKALKKIFKKSRMNSCQFAIRAWTSLPASRQWGSATMPL